MRRRDLGDRRGTGEGGGGGAENLGEIGLPVGEKVGQS